MRKIVLAAILAACAASASAAERRYSVTDFDRIIIQGPYQVKLSTGVAGSAVASGSPEAIDRVSLEVTDRVLRIRPNPSAWGGYPGASAGPIKIVIGTHDLRGATLNGSGGLAIDKMHAMRVDLGLSGSGTIAVAAIDADRLVVAILGAGRISLGGRTKEFAATVQGTGSLDATGLTAEDARVDAASAGDSVVTVHRTANVTSTGQGDVKILGTPACTVKALGSGQVVCGK